MLFRSEGRKRGRRLPPSRRTGQPRHAPRPTPIPAPATSRSHGGRGGDGRLNVERGGENPLLFSSSAPNGGRRRANPCKQGRANEAGRERGTSAGCGSAAAAAGREGGGVGGDGGSEGAGDPPAPETTRPRGRTGPGEGTPPPPSTTNHTAHTTTTSPTPRAHTRHATRGAPPGEEKEERHTALGRRPLSLMILPQVHLRKPCYDFYFL